MKKLYLLVILLMIFSGCANLESSLQQKNYQEAKQIAKEMEKEDVNKELDNGSTYLIETIKHNRPEIVKILINKGADVCKTDKNGLSPLYYAIKNNNIQILNLILNQITKNKQFKCVSKEIATHPNLKSKFISQISYVTPYKNTYQIMTIPGLFTPKEQEKIFSNISDKKMLVKNIPNKYNKLLSIILNYSIKTKNYAVLNALSSKAFIYDINYSMPNVKNSIKYVKTVEKYSDMDLGYITNLVYAKNPEDSLFKNFSNALNVAVQKYLSPNKILIGEYRIPTLKNRLFINDYRKTDKYFVFGLYVKSNEDSWGSVGVVEPIIVNNADWDNIIKLKYKRGKGSYTWIEMAKNDYLKLAKKMHLSPERDTIQKGNKIYTELYMKANYVRSIYTNEKFYYPKIYSLAQNVDFRDHDDTLVPYGTKIDLAKPLIIPHFKTNVRKGEFESTAQFKKRLEKINKENEKILNNFVYKLNQNIQNIKKFKNKFTTQNIKTTVNQIKNTVIDTVAFHSLKNFHYDPDKEMFIVNVKMMIPVNIGKTFTVNHPSVDKEVILQKIQCTGKYGNALKLTFKINNPNIYLAKFSKWLDTAKDYKLKKNQHYLDFIYPYVWSEKFNLSDIFYDTPNGAIKNIQNPCLKSKIFTIKIPVKRKFAPAVDKVLSKKGFKPTLIFEVKDNKLKLVGIKQLEYPNEIYQHDELMKVYNSIPGIKKWLKKYPNIRLTKLAKQRLEELEFKKAIKENTFKSLNRFKKMYPHSQYIDKINDAIFNLKIDNAMKNIKYNWFYGVKWDDISWDGNWAKDGWPTGKGTFHLFKVLSSGVIFGINRIGAIVEVKAKIKNHKLIKCRVSAYLKQTHFLSSDYTHVYSDNCKNIDDMNKKIVDLVNMAIREWNGNGIKNSSCNQIFNTCMKYCKMKSSKGFFNDKNSCMGYCYSGKDACEKGKHNWGLRLSCAGICKGAKEGNGGLLWDSDYDKCVDKCIDKLR